MYLDSNMILFSSFKISWLDFFKNHFKDIDIKNEEEVVVYATRYLAALSPVIKNASDMWVLLYLF